MQLIKHTYVLVIVLLSGITLRVAAQGIPHFIHHPMTHPFHNPASVVRSTPNIAINVIHRSQWLGYNSVYDETGTAPVTQQAQIVFPFRVDRLGMGVAFAQDAVGPLRQQYLQLAVGYGLRLSPSSTLSFGISPLYQNVTSDRDSYRVLHTTDTGIDQALAQRSIDVSFGTMYKYDKLSIGLSALQLRASGLTDRGREYALFSSYQLSLHNERDEASRAFLLTPAVMIRAGYGIRVDVSCMARYHNRLWGGLMWRSEESVAALLGVHLFKDSSLALGYGFEFVTTDARAKQLTSHEVLLSYNVPRYIAPPKRPVYTPRFPF